MSERIRLDRETKLSALLEAHPWLREELPQIHPAFRLLQTPLGKVMLKTATVAEMSRRSGMAEAPLLEQLSARIAAHS